MQDALLRVTEMAPSPLIGVAICVCGNTLISLSLNLQKLAHQRLASKSPNGASTERSPLLETPARPRLRASVSDPDLRGADALLLPVSEDEEARGHRGDDRGDDKRDGDDQKKLDKSYLKSPLWWSGMLLLNLGEIGNFAAYGFAPASLVAPLGSVALIANCFFAPLLLKEPFRKQDILGIALALLGGVTVVYASKNSDKQLYPDEMLHAIAHPAFIGYSITCAVLLVLLGALSRTKYGDRFLMIDLGVCALAGGFTVLSTKAISSFLSLIFLDA